MPGTALTPATYAPPADVSPAETPPVETPPLELLWLEPPPLPMTTIVIERYVRDQLMCLGELHGRSVEEELKFIVKDLLGQEVQAAYRRFQEEDPEGWADYVAEMAEIVEEGFDVLADLARTAAEEFPEYNRPKQ